MAAKIARPRVVLAFRNIPAARASEVTKLVASICTTRGYRWMNRDAVVNCETIANARPGCLVMSIDGAFIGTGGMEASPAIYINDWLAHLQYVLAEVI